jgi:hypothetical protein
VLRKLLLFAALAVAAISCGAESPTPSQAPVSETQKPSVDNPWIAPQSDAGAVYAPWGDSRELACAHMREEMAEGRPSAEGPPSEEPYEPDLLLGFTALDLSPADSATARRIFGQPCAGVANVWAVATSSFDQGANDARTDFALVMRPMLLRLSDGRSVVLAGVRPGDAHVTTGFQAALILGGDQRQPYAMDGGGTFGEPGTLSMPVQQPPGAYHIWLEGGGTWQGHTQGWAGVTDFAGATPRDRGHFPTRAYFPCDRYAQEENNDALCRGATEYALTSIDYSDNGADEITLAWTVETYDEASGERRVNRRTRTITARYELRGGVYRLVGGEEPPRV